jgi:hypothetical protein
MNTNTTVGTMVEFAPLYAKLEERHNWQKYDWLNSYIEFSESETEAQFNYRQPITEFGKKWDEYKTWQLEKKVHIEKPCRNAVRVLYTLSAIFGVALAVFVCCLLAEVVQTKYTLIVIPILLLAVGFLFLGITVTEHQKWLLQRFADQEERILTNEWRTPHFVYRLSRLLEWVEGSEPVDPREAQSPGRRLPISTIMEKVSILESSSWNHPPVDLLKLVVDKLDAEIEANKAAELAHLGSQKELADQLDWKKAVTQQHIVIARSFGLSRKSAFDLYVGAQEKALSTAGRNMAIYI